MFYSMMFDEHRMLDFERVYNHDLDMKVKRMFDSMRLSDDFDYVAYSHELFRFELVLLRIEK